MKPESIVAEIRASYSLIEIVARLTHLLPGVDLSIFDAILGNDLATIKDITSVEVSTECDTSDSKEHITAYVEAKTLYVLHYTPDDVYLNNEPWKLYQQHGLRGVADYLKGRLGETP